MWRRRLLAWEEESVRECSVLLHNIVWQDTVYDSWRWLLDPVHGYSVRGAYRHISSSGDLVDRTLVGDVWQKQIPSKVSILVWRLFRNRIPSKVSIRVISLFDTACSAGCELPESALHLFILCNVAGELWYQSTELVRHVFCAFW